MLVQILNTVIPAPNFLPGVVLKTLKSQTQDGAVIEEHQVDLESTLRNLRGEDEHGRPLEYGDPRSIVHQRWVFERNNPGEEFPDELQVYCPHCNSPWCEVEDGEDYRNQVEDRLSTYDIYGNPKSRNDR